MSTTYIYPSNVDVGGRDIAIAFDEQELETLVKILKKADQSLKIFCKYLKLNKMIGHAIVSWTI
jgi:hypothetical protein